MKKLLTCEGNGQMRDNLEKKFVRKISRNRRKQNMYTSTNIMCVLKSGQKEGGLEVLNMAFLEFASRVNNLTWHSSSLKSHNLG